MRLQLILIAVVAALVVTVTPEAGRGVLGAAENPHSYFESMVARADHWKSYSLRPRAGEPITSPYYEKQLIPRQNGGYAQGNEVPLFVTYDPARDFHPNAQDAAKALVPEYMALPAGKLAASIGPGDTTITVSNYDVTYYTNGRHLKIDGEQMKVTSPITPAGTFTVLRGDRGSSAASHSANTMLYASGNSLPNMLMLPLGTTDGNSYFFSWESFWPDENRPARGSGLDSYKAFQFVNHGIWFEARIRFDGGWGPTRPAEFDPSRHVGVMDFRLYNELGGPATWSPAESDKAAPAVTSRNAALPHTGTFAALPNTWMRHFVLIEQRGNDYDYVSAWVADADRGPVKLLDRLPISVRAYGQTPDSIAQFWLELDTSKDEIHDRQAGLDLVSYHRNFVALRNPGDVGPLLIRPTPGATAPPRPRPTTPAHLRIVK